MNKVTCRGVDLWFEKVDSQLTMVFDPQALELSTVRCDGIPSEEALEEIVSSRSAPLQEDPQSDRLTQIVVNVSQSCNLACRYCYASHGRYDDSFPLLMSEETVRSVCDAFIPMKPKSIMFFGGEPFLNSSAIRTLCESFFKEVPDTKFRVITNGTVMSDEIRRVIQDFDITVTISLDGPKAFQDMLRPFKSGHGTYDTIAKNLREGAFGKRVSFESTYTKVHELLEMSPMDTLDLIRSEFGFRAGIITAALGPYHSVCYEAGKVPAIWRDLYDFTLQSLETENPFMYEDFGSMWYILENRIPDTSFCPVGDRILSVASDGSVYPCHLFVLDKDYRLGHVDQLKQAGALDTFRDRTKQLIPINYRRDKCNDCWALGVCHGCVAYMKMEQGNLLSIPDGWCQHKRETLSHYLRQTVRAQSDPDRWDRILNGLDLLAIERVEAPRS